MRQLALAALVWMVALSLTAATAGAQRPTPPILARLPFADRDELAALAARHDVWEVHHDAGYALVALTADEAETRRKAGRPMTVDAADAGKAATDYPLCYLGVAGLEAEMERLAAAYPALAVVEDYGASWLRLYPDERGGGDRLRALVLGNQAAPEPRPTLALVANVHARELATPELALAFARDLLQGYGTDADATWLLDTQRTVIIVTANPDGHRMAELGYLQRKNANDTVGLCPTPPSWLAQHGVDLNRNHSFRWSIVGASSDPCSQVYHGLAPASEVETQALQELLAGLIPSRRAGPTTPMPDDTTGLLVSLHSYGGYVLWPWGFTMTPAPDAAGLAALGAQLAWRNGYQPGQASVALYSASGDTTDWAYGTLGIPAFTFEVGTEFFQPCADLPYLIQTNLPALRYAARVARAPYALPGGPEVTARPAGLGPVALGASAPLTVTAAVGLAGGTVAAVEASLDGPLWAPGAGIALAAMDGAFDEAEEVASGALPTAGLAAGRRLVYLRARAASGAWGPVVATWLTVDGAAVVRVAGRVTGGEPAPLGPSASGGRDGERAGWADAPLVGARVTAWPGGATTTVDGEGRFALDAPPGPLTLRVTAAGYEAARREVAGPAEGVDIRLDQWPCVLLVDGDPDGAALAWWAEALAGQGRAYRAWRVAEWGSPRLDSLREHGLVVWVGGARGTLSEAQQTTLQGYLAGGGHLLLSGASLLPAVGGAAGLNAFAGGDLRLSAPAALWLTSAAGGDFLADLAGTTDVAALSFTPTSGAAAILRGEGGVVGLAYGAAERRVVGFGVGLEALGATGREALARTLRWLGCPGDCALAVDVNRDGAVDGGDTRLAASSWGATQGQPRYVRHHDVDSSGRVDVVDLAQVSRDQGQTCREEASSASHFWPPLPPLAPP